MDFQDLLAQTDGFGGKIGEGVVRRWHPTNSFLLWQFYLCATFGENRSRNATVYESAGRQADTHTQTKW